MQLSQETFIRKVIHRVAQVAVDAPALRNQGPKGTIQIARNYLEEEIELSAFRASLSDAASFSIFLDDHTLRLQSNFTGEARQNWGAARKAINLFLRDVIYNTYLVQHLGIPATEGKQYPFVKYMEVPLDNFVALGLEKESKGRLHGWKSIRELSPEVSKAYQDFAHNYAARQRIARVHLDLEFWRREDDYHA